MATTIPAGMNFGQYSDWLQQNYQPAEQPATYTSGGGNSYLSGVAGDNYVPGGTGTGAIFNTGETAGYDQLNALHQGAQNDANMYAWGSSLRDGSSFTPQSMTNIDMSGNGTLTGPGGSATPPVGVGSAGMGANVMGGGGRGRRGGMAAAGPQGFQPYNPYLTSMIGDITRRSTDALGQGINMIDQQAIGAGGYGGSRQGVAQAGAIAQSNDNLTGQIAGLLGGDWTNQQNRELQKYGMDQQYQLGTVANQNQATANNNNYTVGMGNVNTNWRDMENRYALGNQGQMQNFYLGNRGLDQQAVDLGARIYGMGNQGEWTGLNNANGIYGNYTGYGNTTNTSGSGTNYAAGVGNGLATYQYLNRP